MHSNHKFHRPFVWFESGGWWFKTFGEHFGPYTDPIEARYNLMVILGLSQQLHDAIAK